MISFLYYMRKYSYYKNITNHNVFEKICKLYYGFRYKQLSLKLGFSIGSDVFGYGLLIPHYGTIVINGEARVGNFAVLHTCTNIAGKKIIGDGLYLSTGCQIVGNISLGDNVSVAANSLVNKSYQNNVLIGGVPAKILKENYPQWYVRDGDTFINRVHCVERLKKELQI